MKSSAKVLKMYIISKFCFLFSYDVLIFYAYFTTP